MTSPRLGQPRRPTPAKSSRWISVEEWEDAVLFLAAAVVQNPQFTPSFEYAERKLKEAREGPRTRAMALLNDEAAKAGCPPINSLKDAADLVAARRRARNSRPD